MSSLDLPEAQIAVHWKEEGYFQPPKKFIEQATLEDPDKKWDKTLDSSNPPFWKWFVGGKINASFNCLDRHLPKTTDVGRTSRVSAGPIDVVIPSRADGEGSPRRDPSLRSG